MGLTWKAAWELPWNRAWNLVKGFGGVVLLLKWSSRDLSAWTFQRIQGAQQSKAMESRSRSRCSARCGCLEEATHFAQAPSQFAARIVGDVPQQLG